MAMYFIFLGTGYNQATYCCDFCREEGLEHVAQNMCNPDHAISHTECSSLNFDHHSGVNRIDNNAFLEMEHGACQFYHINLEKYQISQSRLNLQVPIMDLPDYQKNESIEIITGNTLCNIEYRDTQPDIALSNRKILSLFQTFLI